MSDLSWAGRLLCTSCVKNEGNCIPCFLQCRYPEDQLISGGPDKLCWATYYSETMIYVIREPF